MTHAAVMPPPGFDELSADEKLDYIQALWDRFRARPAEPPVPDWHREILAECLADEESGDEPPAQPWSEVSEELDEALRKVRG